MIKVENLKFRYGTHWILKGVDLQAQKNETLALIGPSGCGKTTLLRLVGGFEMPYHGEITIEDVMVSRPGFVVPPHKRHLSLIFQDLALWPHLTVEEHLLFVLHDKKKENACVVNRVTALLKNVDLAPCADRFPHQLSGGEKQRLAIARGIAKNPKYLLMDEPFNNLDPILKKDQENFLNQLKEQFQMGIIYVSHNIEEVKNIADRIAIMKKGRIIQTDTKQNVLENPLDEFVTSFLNC